MAKRTTAGAWLARAAVVSTCVGVVACGGGTAQTTASGPNAGAVQAYRKQCELRSARQSWDAGHGTYTPATLAVDAWAGHTGTVSEATLATALGKGELANVAIFARGGLGKTKLAESLRAQVCGQAAAFLVDLKDVAQASGLGNPVLSVAAKDAGADVRAFAQEAAQGRLVILADGLDEVDVSARARVVTALRELPTLVPGVQVVLLARPPVVDDAYGFTPLTARLSIRPLACADADAAVAQAWKKQEELDTFKRFLHRYGLDQQTTVDGQCTYPYLASYRDVNTLSEFHKRAQDPKSAVIVNRLKAHEALFAARVGKETEALGWTPKQAMELIDRLTLAQMERGETLDPTFTMDACMDVVDAGKHSSDATHEKVCEKVFQSAIFAPTGKPAQFHFAGEGIAALFAARYLNAQLGLAKKLDCSVAVKKTALVRSVDTFRFLVGLPLGLQCVMPLMDDRCEREPKGDQLEPLDAALPIGPARGPILKTMNAGYEATHWKMCTQKTLKGLDGTQTGGY